MQLRAVRLTALAAACAALISCASMHQRTDSFLFGDAVQLDRPIDAWLRTVRIVSDQLPLASEYPLIEQSYVSIASRYGIRLSPHHDGQPYAVDLLIQAQSYTTGLSTNNSVLAVLSLSASGSDPTGSTPAARVIYSAASASSIQSLYYLYRIGETLFSSLHAKIAADARKERHAGTRGSPVTTSR